MSSELSKTWDEISSNWHLWKSPLRPSSEDIQIIQSILQNWSEKNQPQQPVKIFLLGVTPEIASMSFPFPIEMLAMDQSAGMVNNIWIGDREDRKAVVGNWFEAQIEPQSMDIILADGSYVFFNPDRMEKLTELVSKMLKPNGLFLVRFFTKPERNENGSDLLMALDMGHINNFHSLKFRVAMILQKSLEEGISQEKIHETIHDISEHILSPETGIMPSDFGTINLYAHKKSTMHFPTINELKEILSAYLQNIEVVFPTYDFGDRCPFIIAKPRIP